MNRNHFCLVFESIEQNWCSTANDWPTFRGIRVCDWSSTDWWSVGEYDCISHRPIKVIRACGSPADESGGNLLFHLKLRWAPSPGPSALEKDRSNEIEKSRYVNQLPLSSSDSIKGERVPIYLGRLFSRDGAKRSEKKISESLEIAFAAM